MAGPNEQQRANISRAIGKAAAKAPQSQRAGLVSMQGNAEGQSAGPDTDAGEQLHFTGPATGGAPSLKAPSDGQYNDMLKTATSAGSPKVLGSYKKGGKVKKTGIYKLHKGETVVTKEKSKRMPALSGPSEGHKPDGPHGRAAVHAIGRTKTTGNFKKIEAAKGKGAAIAAYQNKLRAYKAGH